tara:strand:+ start:1147 stop:1371 length:225 start_codon:yes stop_codon:yes gene_type:complete
MADAWNPFDPNNPVYRKVQKQTGARRKRIRNTVVAGGILLAGYLIQNYRKTGNPVAPFFGGPNLDQFGMIRRRK